MVSKTRKKRPGKQFNGGDCVKRSKKLKQLKRSFTYFLAGYHFFFSSLAYGGKVEIPNHSEEARKLPRRILTLEKMETDKDALYHVVNATSPYLSQEAEKASLSLFSRLKKGWQSFQQRTEARISHFAETSPLLDGFCAWIGSVAKTLPPSLYAKTPFEIDYAQDKIFWQAHFSSELKSLQQSALSPLHIQGRLKELQEIVWEGLLSPYVYEVALKELKEQKADSLDFLEDIQDQFQEELKARPAFLRDNFQRDLLTSLEENIDSEKGIGGVEDLLTYYRQIQDPLEYTHSLIDFRRFIQKNYKILSLTEPHYKALSKATIKAINQRDQKQYRALKAKQQSTKSALEELPYYEGEICEDTFNSALPSLNDEKSPNTKASLSKPFSVLAHLKGLTHIAYKGLKYVSEHPVQAITIGLASQVAAAAALKALSAPGSFNGNNGSNNKEELEKAQKPILKQSSRSFQPRYAPRALEEEFQVNTYTTGDQWWPSVAGLKNGNFVVTWHSTNQTGNGYADVYGQLYDNNGTRFGNEFQVNTYIISDQWYPSVAGLSNGDFVVTWESFGQDGDSWGIFGQRYANTGARLGSAFQINNYTTNSQFSPSVAGLDVGGFVATWASLRGSNTGIYGQRYTNAGVRSGNEFQINTYTGSQNFPSVAGLMNGNFIVAWQSDFQDGNGWGIYGQHYANNGTRLGSEFKVNNYTTNYQDTPSVAGLSNGNFVVTWQSNGQDGSGYGTYGQRYANSGARLGNEFLVNTYTLYDQGEPSAAGLSNGDFVVTWGGVDGSGYGGIFGQRYANNGTRLGNEFQVNTYGSPSLSSIAGLSNGGFVVTWHSNYQDGSGYGIFGKVFSSSFVGGASSTTSAGSSTSSGTTSMTGTVASTSSTEGTTSTSTRTGSALPTGTTSFSPSTAGTRSTASTWATSIAGTTDNLATIRATSAGGIATSLSGTTETSNPVSLYATTSLTSPTIASSAAESPSRSFTASLGITSATTSAEAVEPSSSSIGSLPQSTIIAIAAAGGGAAALGTCAGVGYCLYRKHTSKKSASQEEMELAPSTTAFRQSSNQIPSFVVATNQPSIQNSSLLRQLGSSSILSQPSIQPSGPRKGTRFGKTYTTIQGEHGRYALYNKINQEDARLLHEQTGVNVAFAPGQKKTSFTLGSGQFGKLRLARNEETKAFLGVKKIKGDAEIHNSLNEGKIQAKLSGCSHIMPLLDSVESTGSQGQKVLYQFMPLAGFGNGTFFQEKLALVRDHDLKEKLIVHVAKGLLTGVSNMHGADIYHLDIKPTNFVIGKEGAVSIIDFGCALELGNNDTLTEGNGDTRYFSPERFACLRQGKQEKDTGNTQRVSSFSARVADAWAVGVTLLEMALNRYPLEDVPLETRLQRWDIPYFKKMVEKIDLLQHGISSNWIGLVKGLLAINPQERLGIKDALRWTGFREKKYQITSLEEGVQLFKALSEKKEEIIQRTLIPSFGNLNTKPTAYVEQDPKERDKNYLPSSYAPSVSKHQ